MEFVIKGINLSLMWDTYEEISIFARGYAIYAVGYILIFIEAFALSRYVYIWQWLRMSMSEMMMEQIHHSQQPSNVFFIWFRWGNKYFILGFCNKYHILLYLSNKETGDKKLNLQVKHTPIGWVRILIAAIVILVPACLLLMQYRM